MKEQRPHVSILIHKILGDCIKSQEPINERIIKVTIQMRGRVMTILDSYAPNYDAAVQIFKGNSEEGIRNIIGHIPHTHEIVIEDGPNGRAGKQRNIRVIGMYKENVNDNGERLINLCDQYDLKITNKFFLTKTLISILGVQYMRQLKSIIDYLIVRLRSGIKVQDVKVKNCESDNCFVESKVYTPFIASCSGTNIKTFNDNNMNSKKYNLESLEHKCTRYLFRRRLEKKLVEAKQTIEAEV